MEYGSRWVCESWVCVGHVHYLHVVCVNFIQIGYPMRSRFLVKYGPKTTYPAVQVFYPLPPTLPSKARCVILCPWNIAYKRSLACALEKDGDPRGGFHPVLAILKGAAKSFHSLKQGGGGREKFYPVLRGGAKSFRPAIFPFCSPPPLMNDQSLSNCLRPRSTLGVCKPSF